MTLAPDARAVCERVKLAGAGGFAGRSLPEIRKVGFELAQMWGLDEARLALVSHLNRVGPSNVDEIAGALSWDTLTTESHLTSLLHTGYARRRFVAAEVQWRAIFSGTRRGRADTLGAFALLEDESVGERPQRMSHHEIDHLVAPDVWLRVYLPEHPTTDLTPVVVFCHGGAFVSGSLESYDTLGHSLVELSGCAFASVGYRLAPENPFPAQIDDCYRAIEWLLENGESVGVDSTRLAIMGDSAGASLAVVTARRAHDDQLCTVSSQVLLYPALDATMSSPSIEINTDDPLFSRADVAWMYEAYGAPPDDIRASPLVASDLSNSPPTLIITADEDPLRDDGARYFQRLTDSGVEASQQNFEGMMHGFAMFAPALEAASTARALVAAELRRRLMPDDSE